MSNSSLRPSGAVVPDALRVVTSVRLGERVLAWCDDGLLVAEYALFDASETLLHAIDPVTVREAGYMTTARQALERLGKEGVTPELAADAARALSREVVASYSRAPETPGLLDQLGAHELFDGAVYRAHAECYEGMWLDLRALAGALPPRTALMLQGLHLASALSEVPGTTPVHLSTASATRDRRPAERTWQRVSLVLARGVPALLARLTPRPRPADAERERSARMGPALLAHVRERVSEHTSPQLRVHLAVLEHALTGSDGEGAPTTRDNELEAIDRMWDQGDATAAEERIAELERTRGRTPEVRYLRARAALLAGGASPETVARELSRLADEDRAFHEAALGAARTWLAAGEEARARHFARRLAEDPSAPDSERLVALEILDTTTPTAQSTSPPPLDREDAQPTTERMAPPARVPTFSSLGEVPPPHTLPPAPVQTVPPPPVSPEQPPAPRRVVVLPRYDPELVESLGLPFGAGEDALAIDAVPTTPLQARIAMTRLARDLARDYRLWYGKTLRCDPMAIDAMQQHLTRRFAGASVQDPEVAWEVRRHGALLSETIARALGADWVDVTPTEPGYWAMLVPPSTRTWPIGRVYRFVALGHRERDLVGYYLDLDTRARRG